MTPAQWKKMQEKEKAAKKNLGANGPRGYRSRSFESYQKSLEAGDRTAKNMPVFFAKEKLARGEITKADIPYMQRGGSWDNSDVKGIKGWFTTQNLNGRGGKGGTIKWTEADKAYDRAGAEKMGLVKKQKKEKNIRQMNTQEFYAKLGGVREVKNAPKISVGGAEEKPGFKFPWQK